MSAFTEDQDQKECAYTGFREVLANKLLDVLGFSKFNEWRASKDDAAIAFIKDEIEYSSWIVSPAHRKFIVDGLAKQYPCPHSNTKKIATHAIMQNLIGYCKGYAFIGMYASYFKVKFIQAGRFVKRGDFDEFEPGTDEQDVQWESEYLANKGMESLTEEYEAARLPVPQMVVIPFSDQREMKP